MKKFDNERPQPGDKIVIVCDDGCTSAIAYVTRNGEILEAEDADILGDPFTAGSIWFKLPEDYPIAFMQWYDDDDL